VGDNFCGAVLLKVEFSLEKTGKVSIERKMNQEHKVMRTFHPESIK
jgi:hypothetical protein